MTTVLLCRDGVNKSCGCTEDSPGQYLAAINSAELLIERGKDEVIESLALIMCNYHVATLNTKSPLHL